MCWDLDWSDATYLNSGTRTARTKKRCVAGCTIFVGETYYFTTMAYDGQVSDYVYCSACLTASRALGNACRLYDESDDPPIDDLLQAYHDHLNGGELPLNIVPPDVVARLREEQLKLEARVRHMSVDDVLSLG